MTEGIVIRKEEKKHHGIGWVVIAAGASIAAIVLAVVLLGFLGVSTETGLAGPSGGSGSLLAGAGEEIVPSDEPGGIEYGDGFIVETIIPEREFEGKSIQPAIYDLKIVKTKDGKEGRSEFVMFFKIEPNYVQRIVVAREDKESLNKSLRDLFYPNKGGSGTLFWLSKGEERYIRIVAQNGGYFGSSVFFRIKNT